MKFIDKKIIYCKYCGRELENGKCICGNFEKKGFASVSAKKVCDTCKKLIDDDAVFCPYCGIPYGREVYDNHLKRELRGDFAKDVLAGTKTPLFSSGVNKVFYIIASVISLLVIVGMVFTLNEYIGSGKQNEYLESLPSETIETSFVPTTIDIDATQQPVISAHNNWIRQGGYLYCLDKNGDPVIDDWVEEIDEHGNSIMYYFDIDGRLVVNSWIDGVYYVGSDGAMLLDTYTPDGAYVDEDGRVVIDEERKAVAVEKETRVYYESPDENAAVKTSNQKSSSAGVIKGVDETKTYELYIKEIKPIRNNFVKNNEKCNFTYYYPIIDGGREKEVIKINELIIDMFTTRFPNALSTVTDEEGKIPKSITLNTVDQRQLNDNRFIFIISGRLINQKGFSEKKKYRFIYDRKAKELTMLDISDY